MTAREGGGPAPVAVVIVTWNSAAYVEDCLVSIRALERPPAEVVVVDNDSSDDSVSRVRGALPTAVVVENDENAGFCRASNQGYAKTSAPFVLFLNPDTRLTPRFLEELLCAFDDPAVGLAGGKLLRFDEQTLDSAGQQLSRSRQPIDRGFGTLDDGRYDLDELVFSICGAALLARRGALEDVAIDGERVFDETYFAFYEDLDLAWRAKHRGWRVVYRHRAVAYHARGGSARTESVRRRWRSLLARPPAIRFHIVKNRYLTLLRNDSVKAYLRDAPFIWARDAAMIGLLLISSPSVIRDLWRARGLFRRAWHERGARSRA